MRRRAFLSRQVSGSGFIILMVNKSVCKCSPFRHGCKFANLQICKFINTICNRRFHRLLQHSQKIDYSTLSVIIYDLIKSYSNCNNRVHCCLSVVYYCCCTSNCGAHSIGTDRAVEGLSVFLRSLLLHTYQVTSRQTSCQPNCLEHCITPGI